MKKVVIILFLISIGMICFGQIVYNPNIAIKPIPTLSVTSVITTDSTTSVTIRITNSKQLSPFTLRTRDLFIRPVSDPNNLKLIRSEKAPFAPEKHIFSTLNEVFEFTLVFKPLPKGTKYFDLMENMPKREFYVQGIILDPKLNEIIARGFEAYSKADRNGALKAFIEMANADLYFEYGMAYFNIIYLLAQSNRIPEAQEWYDKFKDRFFYDKTLLENELVRLGIRQKLK
ncbi:MAG: hypothetical protein D4R64_06495 [Porphyromonadaceae bacterium]|nr:MAG: hypothetical protein D4R64_06495 [Porphyromonadaceae bacterium]